LYTWIRYPEGAILEGLIANRSRNRMRILAAGLPDALELKRKGTRWLTDRGEQVELEFLAAISPLVEEAAASNAAICVAGSAGI
jgi:hypothetical protein